MFEQTKNFCDSFLDLGVPGFDLAVYKGGKPILRYQNGYRDLQAKTKMDGTERYFIYSCSKPITCTAALQLWEKGLFSLEDRLCDYLPEFSEMTVQTETGIRKAQKPILIRHLFEMTAGLSYNKNTENLSRCREETNGRCPTRETMRYLAKDPLLFEPGTQWHYSLCHDVLAALVEVLSGEKFETYVKKNIFDPLGMQNSTFMLPDSELDTIAPLYTFRDGCAAEMPKELSYKLGTEYASGGAGGISTVDDYMKFLEGWRTDALIKPETRRLMTTNRLTDKQASTFTLRDRYGYGLGVRCSKGDPRYPEFGWGGAACAYLAVEMQDELSVYFGCHLLSSPAAAARSRLCRFVRAELNNPQDIENIYSELRALPAYHLTY